MKEKHEPKTEDCGSGCCGSAPLEMLPIYRSEADDQPCCGPPAGPSGSPDERSGYRLCGFVETFLETAVGRVPRVSTKLNREDRNGTLRVRMGFGRNDYSVAPGLYAVGRPDGEAPVIVTANYKLSFDHLRRELGSADVWILVIDTRGINVWCAAGKGTFGTEELVHRVQQARLAELVRHRRLILPQLGATGVAAHQVKRRCGFEVVWGPVQARDILPFLAAGLKAAPAMRNVTFTLFERLVLVPVELTLLRRHLLWALGVFILISGVGPTIFSISAAWQRGLLGAGAILVGIAAGCVFVPVMLPWIPGRAFALKGAIAGMAVSLPFVAAVHANPLVTLGAALALVTISTVVGSFLAMNFTGSTPFTSPSGVEKEMRAAMPAQLGLVVIAVATWIATAF
jgi:hypothetical protein